MLFSNIGKLYLYSKYVHFINSIHTHYTETVKKKNPCHETKKILLLIFVFIAPNQYYAGHRLWDRIAGKQVLIC